MPITPVPPFISEILKERIMQGLAGHEHDLAENCLPTEKETDLKLRVVRLRAALIGIETICSLNTATGIVPATYCSDEHDGIIGDYVSLLVDGTLLSN